MHGITKLGLSPLLQGSSALNIFHGHPSPLLVLTLGNAERGTSLIYQPGSEKYHWIQACLIDILSLRLRITTPCVLLPSAFCRLTWTVFDLQHQLKFAFAVFS